MQVFTSRFLGLQDRLKSHPEITEIIETPGVIPLQWDASSSWHRAVQVGELASSLKGLVELVDNNPLVCGDEFSVPDAASTLALIAIGPLATSGLLIEPPVMMTNAPADEDRIASFLQTEGWLSGLTLHVEEKDLGSVYASTVVCAIQTPSRAEDLDDLFAERYSRSLYVREAGEDEWHAQSVEGKPHAEYRLRFAPDHPHSLLTIQVMADSNGKCGSAQIVHAFNVMCGFEESLGIT